MSLKSVTGSGGVISTTLCLQTGSQDGGKGGWQWWAGAGPCVCKLSPQGHKTFSCGMMETTYSLSALLPPSALQASGLLCCFSVTHGQEIWAWPRAQSHLSCLDVMAVRRGTNCWISDWSTGPLFLTISFSFLNHSSPVYVFLSCSASFSHSSSLFPALLLLLFSLVSLRRRGDPGVSSQESVRWVVQTTGKMFHFFFFFSLLLHLSNSPLHLSIRVWDCRSPPDWAGWRFFDADDRGRVFS